MLEAGAVVTSCCEPPESERCNSIDGLEVSIVMPCLNEAQTVGRCVDKALGALRRLQVSGEVIVADNGSSDRSPEIAQAHRARVVHVERRGYGSALQAGIAAARGRYVIMGDADDSYDFGNIDPFVARFAPASWKIDRGDLVLVSARGNTWRFEEDDANTWMRVPETADPVLLVRQQ